MDGHKFPYKWTLKDARFTKDKGKVFSCFACGGGSTMGYKLAGFDVIGCNEIDPRMNAAYVTNHHPKYNYLCDIRDMVSSNDLPQELYQLDILDGSPPCSSFSIAGSREEAWGVEKHFKEGQKSQVLDTLFFDFIALAKKLQPKVVIAENVKGLLLGNAVKYLQRIYREFDEAGYAVQHFLVNGKDMGVPQRRERVFFLCMRKDLAGPISVQVNMFERMPVIDMEFNEDPILFGEFADYEGREVSGRIRQYWEQRLPDDDGCGDITLRLYGKEKCFNNRFDKVNEVCHTMPANEVVLCFDRPCFHSDTENCCISTFPQDYYFLANNKSSYICGMSVPPVMMAQVASRVYEYWLSKI